MTSFKMNMDAKRADEVLRKEFDPSVQNVAQIEMGELSRVFAFTTRGQEYIAHFRDSRDSMDKASYLYQAYGSLLPIPRVVKIGGSEGLFYSISERAAGKPISAFDAAEQEGIAADLARHFAVMGQIEVGAGQGFGWIAPDGTAAGDSWRETLGSVFKEDQEGFYAGWTELYTDSFLEKSLFQEGVAAVRELTRYAPTVPQLVHGDFHLGNMLSDGSRVTGIVDWEMAMYGDFMFDLAGLHVWTPQLDFPGKVRREWQTQGTDIPFFDERLRCYQLYKTVDGLRFYAKQGIKPAYDYIRAKVTALLDER